MTSTESKEKAVAALKTGSKKLDQKAHAVESAVRAALMLFIGQEPEFANAVIAKGDEGYTKCLDYVVKGCGTCLPDITAYRRAVEFYFPGAGVHFTMNVNLCASVDGSGDDEKLAEASGELQSTVSAESAEPDENESEPEAAETSKPTAFSIDIDDLFE